MAPPLYECFAKKSNRLHHEQIRQRLVTIGAVRIPGPVWRTLCMRHAWGFAGLAAEIGIQVD